MTRKQARDFAFKIIFSYPFHDEISPEEYILTCYNNTELQISTHDKKYIEAVVMNCFNNINAVDDKIASSLKNWKIERLSKVNRALLRLAVTEITYIDDVPNKVAINEAIELAKPYGDDDSPAFVNGVLANFLK